MRIRKFVWILAIIAWLLSLVFLYYESRASVKQLLVDSVAKNETEVRQLLDVAVAYNVTVKNQMSDNMALVSNEQGSFPLFSSLKNFPELNAYGLQGDELLYGKPYEANLTGIGQLEDVDPATLQEIKAALMLNLSTPIEQKKHEFIWSYYTSDKGFLLLSPRVGIEAFNITESLYNKPFWKIAVPEHNPRRETVISDIYEDAGGQGRMISVSTPVYYGSTFKGVVSLDIGIKYLEDVLHSNIAGLDENRLLISNSGAVVVTSDKSHHATTEIAQFDDVRVTPYQLISIEEDVALLSNLIRNKFYVIYKLPRPQFLLLVAKNAFSKALIYTLVFIVFYLIVYLATLLVKTKKLAEIDGLSQIYNRQTLERISIREFMNTKRRSGKVSVIMIDIDHFKNLNDSYGHETGDNGIRHLAKVVSGVIRVTDIFGRYGGEEFLITLPDTDIEGAANVAEKLRLAIERSSFDNGLTLTISLGCAEYRAVNYNDQIEFQDLCSNADKALYLAKKNGRNRVERYTDTLAGN